MMKKIATIVLGALVVFATGCAAPKVVRTWEPQPLVHWEDLTDGPVVPVYDEFGLIPGKRPGGLFPASMAVTRVAIERTGDPDRPWEPKLTSDPRNEFLRWNSTLDDQFAVGEVFPISSKDLGGGESKPGQILAAFRALHARLGLVYAVNELSETESEMLGVLYDTENKSVVAVLHAHSTSIVPPEVVKKSKEPIDMWETDSRALVRAKFEKILHGCIHELIQRDRPARIVTPVGWKATAPKRSVVWPPRQSRAYP